VNMAANGEAERPRAGARLEPRAHTVFFAPAATLQSLRDPSNDCETAARVSWSKESIGGSLRSGEALAGE